jgi:hypothetical protein
MTEATVYEIANDAMLVVERRTAGSTSYYITENGDGTVNVMSYDHYEWKPGLHHYYQYLERSKDWLKYYMGWRLTDAQWIPA